jgi:hypothetical protein
MAHNSVEQYKSHKIQFSCLSCLTTCFVIDQQHHSQQRSVKTKQRNIKHLISIRRALMTSTEYSVDRTAMRSGPSCLVPCSPYSQPLDGGTHHIRDPGILPGRPRPSIRQLLPYGKSTGCSEIQAWQASTRFEQHRCDPILSAVRMSGRLVHILISLGRQVHSSVNSNRTLNSGLLGWGCVS